MLWTKRIIGLLLLLTRKSRTTITMLNSTLITARMTISMMLIRMRIRMSDWFKTNGTLWRKAWAMARMDSRSLHYIKQQI